MRCGVGKKRPRKEKRSVSSTKTIEERPGACRNYPEERQGLDQAGAEEQIDSRNKVKDRSRIQRGETGASHSHRESP